MKCIKTIKPTKSREVGEFLRIDDVEAESKVRTGYWAYVSKSQWKEYKGVSKDTEQVVDQTTDQVEKQPYKKGSKPEKKVKNEKNSQKN